MTQIILSTAAIITLILFIISRIIKARREIYENRLSLIYDKMKLQLTFGEKRIDKEYQIVMSLYSSLSRHPEVLDLRFLFMVFIALNTQSALLERDKEKYKSIVKGLEDDFGEEFQKLSKEFNYTTSKIIKINLYKAGFIKFFIICLSKKAVKDGFEGIKSTINSLRELPENDLPISYSGMRNDKYLTSI